MKPKATIYNQQRYNYTLWKYDKTNISFGSNTNDKDKVISKKGNICTLKIIQAFPSLSNPVTEAEVNKILESKLNLQLATIDKEGYPIIHPIWFLYDKDAERIFTATSKITKKFHSITKNPSKLYFSIDDENFPYKGVKGRATARILEDVEKNLSIVEKINMKYLGTNEHPLAKLILENTKNAIEAVIEIKPKFVSVWDFGKST